MPRVESLHVYPVKSCGGIDLKEATIGSRGFLYDRHWIITDEVGKKLTQRDITSMATVRTALTEHTLTLSANGAADLKVPLVSERSEPTSVDVWGNECIGLDEGDEPAAWLSSALQKNVRLLRFDESSFRKLDPEWIGDTNATAAFSDVLPFLVVNTASLDALNKMRADRDMPPCTIDRFRANIVLYGLDAWEEDEIPALQISGMKIDLTRPCSRCRVPSIDQQTGIEEDYGNLEVLAEERKFKNHINRPGAMFGVQGMCTRGEGQTLKVGDVMTVVELTDTLPPLPRLSPA
ncbi:MAG: MOSC N-terminal beta barrel domain-containing protein [Armatimonadetes bacterium]|nr:MOSC N-terminal beta barrel domain-containing protein [Armatimonadota bacterium]